MSIRSTKFISRDVATERILLVSEKVVNMDYKGLEEISYDPEYSIESFIDSFVSYSDVAIEKFTNSMLEDILDRPFFRFSMFDNYIIDTL